MRPVTRNVIVTTLVVLALLLALGALPSYLKSGDPYYLEATAVDTAPDGVEAVNASTLFERSYPFTFSALDAAAGETGRSAPYWKGPFGFKGAFTHSPFDEMSSYNQQYPNAVSGEMVFVTHENATYRLELIHPTPDAT